MCQDASARAKSFLGLRKLGLAKKEYTEVRSISIWLENHLWKPNGYTSIRIATHRGWVTIDFEPHKLYWRYANSKHVDGGLASGARIKLDKRNKQLVIYQPLRRMLRSTGRGAILLLMLTKIT